MKKKFFRSRTVAEIKKLKPEYTKDNLVQRIMSLEKDEALIIPNMVPMYFRDSKDFLRHADDVKLKRFNSLKEITNYKKQPWGLREEAFNKIINPFYSFYSFKSQLIKQTKIYYFG